MAFIIIRTAKQLRRMQASLTMLQASPKGESLSISDYLLLSSVRYFLDQIARQWERTGEHPIKKEID